MRKIALALTLTATLTGCAVAIGDRDVLVRHDPEQDRVDVLFVHRGISASGSEKNALALAERVIAGARESGIGWPLDFDLEDVPEDFPPEAKELLAGVTVEEVAPFLDDLGRLSWYQHFRVRNASALLAWLNGSMNEWVLQELSGGDDAEEYPDFHRLALQAAGEDWTWWRFEGTTFVFEVPISEREAARALAEMVEEGLDQDEGSLFPVKGLSALRIADGRMTLTFGEPDEEIVHLRFYGGDDYDPGLLDALRAKGVEPNGGVELESLRKRVLGK